MIDGKTKLCALIGSPVEHSLSPAIHNAGFEELNLNYVYLAFETRDASAAINAMRALNIRGCNVTMPLKEAVIPLLDELDPLAEKIGAVNTVLNKDGILKGYNADCACAVQALEELTDLKNKKVVLLGAGGAGSAIAFGVKEKGADLAIADVDEKKAENLRKRVGCRQIKLNELNSLDFEILINATPTGMHPNEKNMPVPEKILKKGLIVFDIIYNPAETLLLKKAKEKGCLTIPGTKMLLNQAFKAFELFTGKTAPKKVMEIALKKELAQR